MTSAWETLQQELIKQPRRWLVTGVAGFIGSNLLEKLLRLDQIVIGFDNFSTGSKENLKEVQNAVESKQWEKFSLIEGDIADLDACQNICQNIDIVLHQAALGSVPRSIADPIRSHKSNVDGFLNMLVAAREAKVKRFVYASSSSVYGDHPALPKVEHQIGEQLSPYAVTKYTNELYSSVFYRCYGLETIGLRYFNVFGPRQDPAGPYAAVIPRFTEALFNNKAADIYGDGETSRDFCYIENVVQANLLAATVANKDAINQIYNIAVAEQHSLKQLLSTLSVLYDAQGKGKAKAPNYCDFRAGDVRHSLADISKAKTLLAYNPTHKLSDGLKIYIDWFLATKSS